MDRVPDEVSDKFAGQAWELWETLKKTNFHDGRNKIAAALRSVAVEAEERADKFKRYYKRQAEKSADAHKVFHLRTGGIIRIDPCNAMHPPDFTPASLLDQVFDRAEEAEALAKRNHRECYDRIIKEAKLREEAVESAASHEMAWFSEKSRAEAAESRVASLEDEIKRLAQNKRIVETVDSLVGPESARLVEATLIAVDRAEKAEAEKIKLIKVIAEHVTVRSDLREQLRRVVGGIYTSEDFADAVGLAKPGCLLPLDDEGNLSAQGVTVLVHAVRTLADKVKSLSKELKKSDGDRCSHCRMEWDNCGCPDDSGFEKKI